LAIAVLTIRSNRLQWAAGLWGEINFGEVQFSQSKVASTSGLCLRNPPHAAESFTKTSWPMTTPHGAAHEHGHPQHPRLPIRYAWAERAKTAGYPERFAMENLGHNSKAVHRAYARRRRWNCRR
jgi:hypothetical protein